MPGFDNGVMFADNVDFTGSFVNKGSAQVTTNGQLLIGSTAAPHIKVGTLASSDSSIVVTNGSGSIDLSTGEKVINVTLTSAQIKNLFGNPFEIIPAPGAGKVIYVTRGWFKLNYGGTSIFTNETNLQVLYAFDGSNAYNAANTLPASMVMENVTCYYPIINGASVIAGETPIGNIENANVQLVNITGNITGNAANDNTITIQIHYYINTVV